MKNLLIAALIGGIANLAHAQDIRCENFRPGEGQVFKISSLDGYKLHLTGDKTSSNQHNRRMITDKQIKDSGDFIFRVVVPRGIDKTSRNFKKECRIVALKSENGELKAVGPSYFIDKEKILKYASEISNPEALATPSVEQSEVAQDSVVESKKESKKKEKEEKNCFIVDSDVTIYGKEKFFSRKKEKVLTSGQQVQIVKDLNSFKCLNPNRIAIRYVIEDKKKFACIESNSMSSLKPCGESQVDLVSETPTKPIETVEVPELKAGEQCEQTEVPVVSDELAKLYENIKDITYYENIFIEVGNEIGIEVDKEKVLILQSQYHYSETSGKSEKFNNLANILTVFAADKNCSLDKVLVGAKEATATQPDIMEFQNLSDNNYYLHLSRGDKKVTLDISKCMMLADQISPKELLHGKEGSDCNKDTSLLELRNNSGICNEIVQQNQLAESKTNLTEGPSRGPSNGEIESITQETAKVDIDTSDKTQTSDTYVDLEIQREVVEEDKSVAKKADLEVTHADRELQREAVEVTSAKKADLEVAYADREIQRENQVNYVDKARAESEQAIENDYSVYGKRTPTGDVEYGTTFDKTRVRFRHFSSVTRYSEGSLSIDDGQQTIRIFEQQMNQMQYLQFSPILTPFAP